MATLGVAVAGTHERDEFRLTPALDFNTLVPEELPALRELVIEGEYDERYGPVFLFEALTDSAIIDQLQRVTLPCFDYGYDRELLESDLVERVRHLDELWVEKMTGCEDDVEQAYLDELCHSQLPNLILGGRTRP